MERDENDIQPLPPRRCDRPEDAILVDTTGNSLDESLARTA